MAAEVRPARRVVSLVPSLTESVWGLGAGDRLVGRTRWCVRPAEVLRVEPVGGTKDPDLDRIRALAPDLVLANREENRREDVEALSAFTTVWVTATRAPGEVPELLEELGSRLGSGPAGRRWARRVRAALASGGAPARPPVRALYLVWRRPWMAAGRDTYIGGLLEAAGFENAAAGRKSRYPALEAGELGALAADLVVLPDEPFRFGPRHQEELERARVAPLVVRVRGDDFCWFGTRTAQGLAAARRLERSAARALGRGPAA